MSLILRIKSGPLEGKVFALKNGAIIGRTGVAISVPDPKISGQHARLSLNKDDTWSIFDLGSTNGIKVEGKRLAQATLKAGMNILIGRTEFEVVRLAQEKSQLDSTVTTPRLPPIPDELPTDVSPPALPPKVEPPPGPPSVSPSPKVPPTPQDWSEYFIGITNKALSKIASVRKELHPFTPLVVLTIYRGLQIGTEWVLGYGPRTVGLQSAEFPLFEPGAPPSGFTLTPKDGGVFYETSLAGKFLLNGKPVATEELKSGDVISIGETHIRVSFKNERI